MDDQNFAYELLIELTRTFLAYADDVQAQDAAAYAMQVFSDMPPVLILAECFVAISMISQKYRIMCFHGPK